MFSFDRTSTASPEGRVFPKVSSAPAPPPTKGLSLLAFSSYERKLTLQQHISVPCVGVGQLGALQPLEYPLLYADLPVGVLAASIIIPELVIPRHVTTHLLVHRRKFGHTCSKFTNFPSAAHKSSRGSDHDEETVCPYKGITDHCLI